MKKLILIAVAFVLLSGMAIAEDSKPLDQNKLFYSANSLYEKREYAKALEEYNKILDLGIDSGPLYFNMGNSYFKLGKLGYAILYYAKARRLMPYDSDLKTNLSYARSLVESSQTETPRKNPVVTFIKMPFRDFNFNTLLVSALIIYLVFLILQIVGIFNPVFSKRTRLIAIAVLLFLVINLGAFAIRFYDEKIIHRGIVVQKGVECKYEPIDKSTTFFRPQEGEFVAVVKTRDGWRQIKRTDGKAGWVKQESVEEI